MRLLKGRKKPAKKQEVKPYLPFLHDYPWRARIRFYVAIGAWHEPDPDRLSMDPERFF